MPQKRRFQKTFERCYCDWASTSKPEVIVCDEGLRDWLEWDDTFDKMYLVITDYQPGEGYRLQLFEDEWSRYWEAHSESGLEKVGLDTSFNFWMDPIVQKYPGRTWFISMEY